MLCVRVCLLLTHVQTFVYTHNFANTSPLAEHNTQLHTKTHCNTLEPISEENGAHVALTRHQSVKVPSSKESASRSHVYKRRVYTYTKYLVRETKKY